MRMQEVCDQVLAVLDDEPVLVQELRARIAERGQWVTSTDTLYAVRMLVREGMAERIRPLGYRKVGDVA